MSDADSNPSAELKPIPFVPELHFEQVRRWYEYHGEELPLEALPPTGFIIPWKAAGFLYRTDSCMAFIEGLVASTALSREERSQALDAIVLAIIHEARRLGFKSLLGYTGLDAVVKRAERLGFSLVEKDIQLVAFPL